MYLFLVSHAFGQKHENNCTLPWLCLVLTTQCLEMCLQCKMEVKPGYVLTVLVLNQSSLTDQKAEK